jgi:hypothetical protein
MYTYSYSRVNYFMPSKGTVVRYYIYGHTTYVHIYIHTNPTNTHTLVLIYLFIHLYLSFICMCILKQQFILTLLVPILFYRVYFTLHPFLICTFFLRGRTNLVIIIYDVYTYLSHISI